MSSTTVVVKSSYLSQLVVPHRTIMYDDRGVMTRPWVIFLERVAAAAAEGQNAALNPPTAPSTPPTGIPNVPPVTINSATVTFRSNAQAEIDVKWTPDPTATATNFTGVAVYLEDPDISSKPSIPLSGSQALDGSKQLAGNWIPKFENDSVASPAMFLVGATGTTPGAGPRTIRVYLAAYGPNTTPTLVRANQTGATPSITVAIGPYGFGQSGMEYAWLITNPQVKAVVNLNRPDPNYYLTFAYTPPDPTTPLPKGMNPFGGVRIFYVYYDQSNNPDFSTASDSGIDVPVSQANGGVRSPVYPLPGSQHFRCYFCSADNATPEHVNTLVNQLTPFADVIITAGNSQIDVTSFTVTNNGVIFQASGHFVAQATLTWIPPAGTANARFQGVDFYLVATTGTETVPQLLAPEQSNTALTFQLQTGNVPTATETWTIAAISVDTNGVLADNPANFGQSGFHSPTATWIVGPPGVGTPGGGQEYAPLVTLGTQSVVPTETTSSDGVRMVSFKVGTWTEPASNKYGGAQLAMVINHDTTRPYYWSIPKGQTTFTTPQFAAPGVAGVQMPVDFYVVSDDPQGHKNTLVDGVTPKLPYLYTPTSGAIVAQRFTQFDTTQFQWQATGNVGLQGINFQANIINVGKTLVVGGGSVNPASFKNQQNGQIAVMTASDQLVGWIGQQQPSQGSGSPTTGAWFSALWVGGADPRYAPVYIDNSGIVMVGGVAAANNAPYPYISVRDASNNECGRIGAKLNVSSGLPGDGVGSGPPAQLTSGAWFTQLAAGGDKITNWTFMLTPDATQPYLSALQIRDCKSFTINYAANLTGSPQYNQAYQVQFGNNVWVGSTLGYTWFFPGFTLYETGTHFGSVIINRGMIIRGPQANNPVLVSLVQFNGDSGGSDTPSTFWGQLAMYSPVSPFNQTVYLASGSAANGNGTMTISDATAAPYFQVQSNKSCLVYGPLWVNGPSQYIQVSDGSSYPEALLYKDHLSIFASAGTTAYQGQVIVASNYAYAGGGYSPTIYGQVGVLNGVPILTLAGANPVIQVGGQNGFTGTIANVNGKTLTVTAGIITNWA